MPKVAAAISTALTLVPSESERNRSFIVNLRYVSNVTADYLSVGDTRITISKSHRKELMQRFSSFLGDSL